MGVPESSGSQQTSAMKIFFFALAVLDAYAVADAVPNADANADADADPWYRSYYGLGHGYYGGYRGYYGYGLGHYGGYRGYLGKRSADAQPDAQPAANADANADAWYGRYGYGLGYGGYGRYYGYARPYGYYGRYWGKKKRSADATPDADADADPYYLGYHGLGLGYRAYGYPVTTTRWGGYRGGYYWG